jgi:FkbM family methyltransferase
MTNKLAKLVQFLGNRSAYPDVLYFDAPSQLRILGAKCRSLSKGYYSQQGQDSLVFNYFFRYINSKDFPRLFVDIGCNDPVIHSNSYFFESNQHFKVLAIDALPEIKAAWTRLRPAADFVSCAVGATEGEIRFDVVKGDNVDSMYSSVSGMSAKSGIREIESRTVKVRRLTDILAERQIEFAGIVSMDIEGYELPALQGLDFTRFKAYIFIIENNGNDLLGDNSIRDLMISKGYLYFARIWCLDDIFVHPDLFRLLS